MAFQASISDRLGLFVRNLTTALAAVIICERIPPSLPYLLLLN